MLKLKLQYVGHLMRRTDSFEKTVMLEKIEGRRRERQRMRWLDGIINGHRFGWTLGVGDGHLEFDEEALCWEVEGKE